MTANPSKSNNFVVVGHEIIFSHSTPSTDSRRAVVRDCCQLLAKKVHEVFVNYLYKLSLPREIDFYKSGDFFLNPIMIVLNCIFVYYYGNGNMDNYGQKKKHIRFSSTAALSSKSAHHRFFLHSWGHSFYIGLYWENLINLIV